MYRNKLVIVGSNCAGIKNKSESLRNLIKTLDVGILFLQETKLCRKNQIKVPNIVIFETNRTQNGGGGLITAVHEKFEPTLLQSDQDNPDVLIVQCKISSFSVSLINGYGPQENEPHGEKMKFFTCFEIAIQSALFNGNLICSELDANSKIGLENILSDPNNISANGHILMEIVNRNGLIVVNSTSKCFGTITRRIKTKISEEKSVIDYYIVCPKFFELISSMEIDENRKYVLTKYSSRMGVKCTIESDHNPLICTLNVKWDKRIKTQRQEIFKLKHEEGLRVFKEITSNCPKLIELSLKSSNFQNDANQWLKKLNVIMHQSFKKIIITGKGKASNPELDSLMRAKQMLRTKLGEISGLNQNSEKEITQNIQLIENEISKICSEQNCKIVKQHFAELSSNDGQVSRLNMWKLKRKLCPRTIEPPMAKKDANGKLVSNPAKLKQLYADTYEHRLRHRTIRPEYKQLENLKNFLFEINL